MSMTGYAGYARAVVDRCEAVGEEGRCDLSAGHDEPDEHGGIAAHMVLDPIGRMVYGWAQLDADDPDEA